MGQKEMSGYPAKPVNKWIYNNYEDKSFNWMYSEKRVDQDNHQFHCKVQYWQICIKKTAGSPSWFFVFFLVLQFILKVLVLLSGQWSLVFLYYVILKLNCSFLSSNAFSSDKLEITLANFLFCRFETCSLISSCDVLSESKDFRLISTKDRNEIRTVGKIWNCKKVNKM